MCIVNGFDHNQWINARSISNTKRYLIQIDFNTMCRLCRAFSEIDTIPLMPCYSIGFVYVRSLSVWIRDVGLDD